MQIDANRIIAELQAQRNQALDGHAAASARAAALSDELEAAKVKIAELTEHTTLPGVEN